MIVVRKVISKNNVRSNQEIQNVITKHEYFALYNAICSYLESYTEHTFIIQNLGTQQSYMWLKWAQNTLYEKSKK